MIHSLLFIYIVLRESFFKKITQQSPVSDASNIEQNIFLRSKFNEKYK